MAVYERVELPCQGAGLDRVVVEDLVGSELTAEVGIAGTRDGCDARAHGLAELDGGAADSAAGADHQQSLAALQPQPVPQDLQSGEADGRQRCRRDEVDGGGRGRHLLRFRDEILGDGTGLAHADAQEAPYRLPGFQTLDPRAERGHLSRVVHAGPAGEGPQPESSQLSVDGIDAGRVHLDQYLAARRGRHGDIADLQHFRPTGAVDLSRSHRTVLHSHVPV
ncbi:hypothetical protein SAURM35S_06792 [Streptomyces aurantiogriseus]